MSNIATEKSAPSTNAFDEYLQAPLSAEHVDAVQRHVARLAELEGVQLRMPPGISGDVENLLQAISDFNGTPIYRVILPPAWNQKDLGPMLMVSDGGEGPRLTVARRNGGSYEQFDDKHLNWRHVRRGDLFHSTAWKIVRTLDNTQSDADSGGYTAPTSQDRPDAEQAQTEESTANTLQSVLWSQAWPILRASIGKLSVCVVGSMLLGFAAPLALKHLVDTAIPTADAPFLLQLFVLLIVVNLAQALIAYTRSFVVLRTQLDVLDRLQTAVIHRVLNAPFSFLRKFTSGDLAHRTMLIMQVSQQLGGSVLLSGMSALVGSLGFFVALSLSPQLLLFSTPLALAEAGVLYFVIARIRRHSQSLEIARGDMLGFVSDSVRGITKLHAAGAVPRFTTLAGAKIANTIRLESRIQGLINTRDVVAILLPAISTVVILAIGYRMMSSGAGSLTLGSLAGFLAAFRGFSQSLSGAGALCAELFEAQSRMKLAEPIIRAQIRKRPGPTQPPELTGDIRLVDVSYKHPAHSRSIFQDANFHCAAGQVLGIMGKSGSGKSTLLRILLGLEDNYSGSVQLDGLNLRTLDDDLVRRQMGAVLQTTRVLAGTIAHNVGLGREIDIPSIQAALDTAELNEDIQRMPLGLKTVISEGGSNLSGGQRQRLLLARAIAHRPKLLFLDEALSGLDVGMQKRIVSKLRAMGCSVIIISHRRESLSTADKIYAIRNGRVTEEVKSSVDTDQ